MNNDKIIISHIETRKHFFDLLNNNPGLIIIKFGATWCRPCKIIKNVVDAFFASSPNNVICCDIDVDESFDLYSFMKNKKMVNGIPVILCYKKGNLSYIPDDMVVGIEPEKMDQFFKNCGKLLNSVNI